MNNSKDIILIYTNGERKDLGVLQDYSFDMCYGDSDNTFECKIQKYNPALSADEPLTQDSVLYIEFTEYGGIVDKKTVDTKNGEVILAGRTWHGFLNSFVIEPKKGKAYRTYQGEANTVIAQIIRNIGLGSWFTVENEDSGITIPYTTVRYEKAYDCIMSMLLAEDAKLIMWYQNRDDTLGKVHLKAVSRVNTGAFEDFDTSQTPFKAGKAFNKVNDLICLGQGSGKKRAVIHLHADDNGGILPYCRTNPKQDSDYYTDLEALAESTNPEDIANYQIISANMLTGDKRYSHIYDYPSAEITTNYLVLTSRPSNWEDVYTKYYYRDDSQTDNPFVKFEREYHDEYHLLTEKPKNWEKYYKKYYVKEHNADTTLQKVEDGEEAVIYRPNTDYDGYEGLKTVNANQWKNYFEKESKTDKDLYYEKVPTMDNYEFRKVEPVQTDEYHLYEEDEPPFDWKTNYGSYYRAVSDGTSYRNYEPIPGIEKEKYKLTTIPPTTWPTDYGSYYIKMKRDRTINNVYYKVGEYITVSQAVNDGIIDGYYNDGNIRYEYPKWKKKTYYRREIKTYTPDYEHFYQPPGTLVPYVQPFYKTTKAKAPRFVSGKYYKKYVSVVPMWKPQVENWVPVVDPQTGEATWQLLEDFGGYYEKIAHVETIPTFEDQTVYYPVEDRFAELCAAGVKKLAEISDTDSLEISLALESDYDVGDIVGSVDMETGIDVTKQILRKVIKIKKGILSINYEVE